MTHFAILCWDGEDSAHLRAEARDAHFARIEAILGSIAIAGPLKDADGTFVGSLVIVIAENETAARAILEGDPYFIADVWACHEIHAFVPAAGGWIGGKVW